MSSKITNILNCENCKTETVHCGLFNLEDSINVDDKIEIKVNYKCRICGSEKLVSENHKTINV